MVKSKGRQQKPTAPTAARLIGCGGRAAAAAAAVVGTQDVDFFFQAEDGIRDRSPSRGLGDVYKRQDKRYCWVT